MSTTAETRTVTVALIGNPNTGKSTLFTGLVGVRQHVGNYPGVTVEKKTGRMEYAGRQFELIDLPGLYSLAPRSRDEMVAVDLLLGRRRDMPQVDAVLCIVDASNLQRNLYLVSQVLELGLPTVVAVNMLDVAEDHGIRLDLARLEQQLGVPVAPVQANRRIGLSRLKALLAEAAQKGEESEESEEGRESAPNAGAVVELPPELSAPPSAFRLPPSSPTPLPEPFEAEVALLEAELAAHAAETRANRCRAAWCDGCCWMSTATCSGRCCTTAMATGRGGLKRRGPGWRRRAAPCRRSKPRPATTGPGACSTAC